MDENLIYDVGMNNGDDTAHYLQKGYRVVAIEADPSLAEASRKRFSSAIDSGQLIILEKAIGPEKAKLPFWISSKNEFNSFDRENASKWGHTCHSIEVQAVPFEEILAEFGVPYYLKVDIEGADRNCLEAIDPFDPPRFVSFEKQSLEDLFLLRQKGYSRFKLIWQEDLRQLAHQPKDENNFQHLQQQFRNWGRRWAERLPMPLYMQKGIECLRNFNQIGTQLRSKFPYGASGPFGDETDGPWRTLEEVVWTWLAFDRGHTASPNPRKDDWFDVHCSL